MESTKARTGIIDCGGHDQDGEDQGCFWQGREEIFDFCEICQRPDVEA